VKHFKK